MLCAWKGENFFSIDKRWVKGKSDIQESSIFLRSDWLLVSFRVYVLAVSLLALVRDVGCEHGWATPGVGGVECGVRLLPSHLLSVLLI